MIRYRAILDKYPSIELPFSELRVARRNEILEAHLAFNNEYQQLSQRRANISQVISDVMSKHNDTDTFEAYSNAVYAEDVFELDLIYKEAFLDAIELTERLGLICP